MRNLKYRFIYYFSMLLALAVVWKSAAVASPDTLTVAFGSCVQHSASPIWNSIRTLRPDALLLLGDNIYQDPQELGNETLIRKHYDQIWGVPVLRQLFAETKVFAIWDDHDFGPNDSDSTSPYQVASKKAFRSFWRNPPPPVGLTESIAFKVELGPATFLMTDGRTFRINPGNGAHPQMFGKQQMSWLKEELLSPHTAIVVIASGSELLNVSGTNESLLQYPDEQAELINAIGASPANVVVISGDRHYAEIVHREVGKKQVYEIASSPLSAGVHSSGELPGMSNRVSYFRQSQNFGLLELDRRGDVIAKIFDRDGVERLRQTIP